jgi:AcrR family transcriptional regulator
VPRDPEGNTRARILDAALDLFAEQGMQRTSLRQIADRLGITKPALYYHFDSRDELVRSLVQPLIDDVEALLARVEREGAQPRALLGEYFDLAHRHRRLTLMVVRDLSALAVTDFGRRALAWQHRMTALLVGPDPDLAARARAIVAVGGLSDCTIQFPEFPPDLVRAAAVEAACAALGLPAAD